MTLTSRLVTPLDQGVLERIKEAAIELARPEQLKAMNYNHLEAARIELRPSQKSTDGTAA